MRHWGTGDAPTILTKKILNFMAPNEEMNQALLPILEKMRQQGAGDEQITLYRNGFLTGAMWRASHPHWISVEDELPKDGQVALVTTPRGNVRMYVYEGGKFKDFILNESDVSYWMPLPSPHRDGSLEEGGEE